MWKLVFYIIIIFSTHNNLKCLEPITQNIHSDYLTISNNEALTEKKSYKITIILHLYELKLIDWFIEKINAFIAQNPENVYSAKITIPIDTNILHFDKKKYKSNYPIEYTDSFLKYYAPYNANLINSANAKLLGPIFSYINEKLLIPTKNIQIIFCENRGVDIGGFFLALDQIKQQKHEHDFLIKIHSKINNEWRDQLMFFLKEKINPLLNQYDSIYTSQRQCPDLDGIGYHGIRTLQELQKELGLKEIIKFHFPCGTIFVASSRFTDFIIQWDLISLFKKLNQRKNYRYEPLFERLFGAIFEKLKFKVYNPPYA